MGWDFDASDSLDFRNRAALGVHYVVALLLRVLIVSSIVGCILQCIIYCVRSSVCHVFRNVVAERVDPGNLSYELISNGNQHDHELGNGRTGEVQGPGGQGA